MGNTPALLRELAARQTGSAVLSVYARTDPRDPANTAHAPGWLVAFRNGVRTEERRLADRGDGEARRHLMSLARRVEAGMLGLHPSQRARGLAWFLAADGTLDQRVPLQLPPRADVVRWDERPFVSPLVDVLDRGRATGLVLVSGTQVRLLHWEGGRVHEPERSTYQLELGDWRDYSAYAAANPARGQQTATHDESYRARVEDRRARFFEDAARAFTGRLPALGWERLVLAAEGQVATRFAEALPEDARRLVVTSVDLNLNGEQPAAVAAALEQPLEDAWEEQARERAEAALAAHRAGGLGAAGPSPVLDALAEGRVEWLVLDPLARFEAAGLSPAARHALNGDGGDLIAERAVELAVATGAGIHALPAEASPALADGDGMVATLRY